MNGRRLGALGSLILAETLYKALAASRPSDVLDGPSAECEFSKLARVVYGQVAGASRLARCAPHIETIPDLLVFVAPTIEKPEMALPFLRVHDCVEHSFTGHHASRALAALARFDRPTPSVFAANMSMPEIFILAAEHIFAAACTIRTRSRPQVPKPGQC